MPVYWRWTPTAAGGVYAVTYGHRMIVCLHTPVILVAAIMPALALLAGSQDGVEVGAPVRNEELVSAMDSTLLVLATVALIGALAAVKLPRRIDADPIRNPR
ncbi:hypothetical protein AB0B07_25000 [Streptomyces sioyaensis]|uniref:hypothetical protein n=1 Tax=Streptomyces sioyaensis TaxID=67364 RepID=UPI003406AB18